MSASYRGTRPRAVDAKGPKKSPFSPLHTPPVWPFCAADGTIRTALALPLREASSFSSEPPQARTATRSLARTTHLPDQNPGIPAQSPDQTPFESHEKVIQKVTHWTCEHSKGCKSVNCHRNGPKLGPIRLNHRSEHSALRAWTPVARTAPLWSQMGMPSPCPDSISLLQNCISATPCTKSPPRSFPQSLESACTGCTKTPDRLR